MGRTIKECYYCNLVKPTHGWGLCASCYKSLRENPDYIPKHKRPKKKCKQCGGKYHATDLCKSCYEKTPEAKARTKRSKAKPENKAKQKIRNKKWREKNREHDLKRMNDYYHNVRKNSEKEKLRNKQRTANGEHKKYHRKNKEKRNSYNNEWRLKNPNYQKQWAKKNPFSKLKSQQKYAKKHSIYYTKIQLKSWGDVIKHIWNNCIICGSTEKLEAHHVKPRAQFPELALEPDNGVTLCKKCHNEITQLLKKVYA